MEGYTKQLTEEIERLKKLTDDCGFPNCTEKKYNDLISIVRTGIIRTDEDSGTLTIYWDMLNEEHMELIQDELNQQKFTIGDKVRWRGQGWYIVELSTDAKEALIANHPDVDNKDYNDYWVNVDQLNTEQGGK